MLNNNIQKLIDQILRMVSRTPQDMPIAIVGQTGVGKSEVADKLADQIDGEIISADSMQIYRGMDIGTAKVKVEDRSVPYHCLDIVDPGQAYSAALYQQDSRRAMQEIIDRGKRPIFCGGTGFYLRAALDEMNFINGEQVNNPVRDYCTKYSEAYGANKLHEILAEKDPKSAELIHPNNVKRVIRALEMLEEGTNYFEQVSGMKDFIFWKESLLFGLRTDRAKLYEKINIRVDKMIQLGLLEEVRGLVDQGFEDALTASQAIGYKEIIDYFNGEISFDRAVELIKQSSRRYAKRQDTWFRRDPRIVWLEI